jgi:hypothetical protein
VLLLVAASSAAAQESKRYTLAGDEFAVYNLAGEVTVSGGSGTAVVVEVTAIGADAGRLTVESGELRGIRVLRVLYPADEIVYRALGRGSHTDFTIRTDGTWGDFGGHWRGRADGRRITIRGDGSGLEAAANLRITVPEGKKVGIYLGVGRVEAHNVAGDLRLDAASADITARQIRGGLNIDTGSGDVRVETVEGAVSLDTGSGDVTVTGMARGSLGVDTGSGSVLGSRLSCTAINVDTGSGDVRLDRVTAPRLSLDTGSGTVHVELTGPLEEMSVSTGSGDVTVRLPDNVGAMVDLDTSSGDFTLDFPLELARKDEGNIRGKLGDGRGRLQIDTGSGDISLIR